MKRLLSALLLSLVGCIDYTDIDGNGRLVDVQRDVAAFRAVEVADGLRAEIAVGPPNVTMHLDDNIVRYVRVEVRGDVLFLEAKEGNMGFDPSEGAVIRVSGPAISAVTVRDGSSARAEARGEDFSAASHDGSRLAIVGQDVQVIHARASDGSRIEVTGAVTDLVVDAIDGSKIESEAASDSVEVRSRAGSAVRARASRSVRVQASDGSRVRIRGNPESRDVTTSDGSSVVFVD